MTAAVTKQSGVTLIELLVSIVIVSIAASGVLGVLSMTTAGSADPMIRHQAAAIAEAYLEEILLKPVTDPDGIDGEAARADFDDLDDFDGLADAGARDQFGNAMTGLGNYNVAVAVSPSTGLPAVPLADALRVDVVVTHGVDISFVLSGYRTRL
jgi:MSHA pilin protein MshD